MGTKLRRERLNSRDPPPTPLPATYVKSVRASLMVYTTRSYTSSDREVSINYKQTRVMIAWRTWLHLTCKHMSKCAAVHVHRVEIKYYFLYMCRHQDMIMHDSKRGSCYTSNGQDLFFALTPPACVPMRWCTLKKVRSSERTSSSLRVL